MKLYFDFKLSIFLITAFILFTVIGTLSHEYGHYIAGKIVGINSRVSYSSIKILDYNNNKNYQEYEKIYNFYKSIEKSRNQSIKKN